MKSPIIIGICILLIVILCGGWYVYANPTLAAELGIHHSMSGGPDANGVGTTTPHGYGGMQGGFATGSIEELNGTGFTITLSNGDTKNIDLSATTTLQNYASASSTPTTITADQLSVGEQVSVIGMPNSDGSINARMVRTGDVPTRGAGGYGGHRPAQTQ